MFGYVKPDKENLLVKDLALYKATYCGLCSVIKKRISLILPFTLSYDFVFLAMIRSALCEERSRLTKGCCKYNPLKKCAFSVCENETLYTARSALILTFLKLEDDLSDKDTGFFKRIGIKLFHAHLKPKVKALTKSNAEYEMLLSTVRKRLSELSTLENEHSPDIDKACELFGDIMADITAFGIKEKIKPIATEIGSAIGRYIYLIDAIDDLEGDAKSGAYNPLVAKYGSVSDVRLNIEELDIAMSMFTQRAVVASELLNDSEYTRIIRNILTMGLGAESYKVMTKNGGKND